MSNKVIIMGMTFDEGSAPDFGSLFAVRIKSGEIKAVNDYAGENESDAAKLADITNAAPGSTCLFSNGSLYRLELSGWKKFGEADTPQAASANTNSVNLSPLNIDTITIPDELDVQENDLSSIDIAPPESDESSDVPSDVPFDEPSAETDIGDINEEVL